MKASHIYIRLGVLLLTTVALLFCSNKAYSESSVIGGTEVANADQESRGLVRVGGGCSGVLLSNDLVLTAGHCINNHQNPSSVAATANWGGSANRTRLGRAIYKFADFNSERGADLALVYLATPFQVTGSTTGFSNQLNLEAPSSVLNSMISVFGLGFNVVPNLGFGTWRTANLTVSSVDDRIYSFNANANGQIIAPGDSGGPDFIGAKLTGIHSGASWNCSNGTTAATCRATITRINSGFSVSVPAMKSAIQAVRATSWNPTQSSFWMDVFSDEISATRYGWSNDNNVNDVEWAQAFRSANEMCFNRGYVGGHLTGHNILERDVHGLVCGGPGAIWYDATSQELQNTGFGFADTNLVHWAQANRAATWLCENFQRGFVGGHFNGHQSNGRFGLICYSSGAQWFDVTQSQYSGLGYVIADVNTTHWAYATRAANDFCVSKGFIGGYMNGHQSGELIGTVCQGNPTTPNPSSTAILSVNFTSGAPGSYFALTGEGFTANSQEDIYANGSILGKALVDSNGKFVLNLSTNFADLGDYWISTNSPSAPTQIYLDMNAELRAKEGATTKELNLVVDKIIRSIHLPILYK